MPLGDEPVPLTSRMSNLGADPEYRLVQQRVLELTGIDLDAYKRQQMLRRLDAILSYCELTSLPALAAALKPGSAALQEFLERFTINVSECYRDRPRFDILARQIIPELARSAASLKIWSAGCSYGAEPYSLALILKEANIRGQIVATDIDPKILLTARAGDGFTAPDLRNLPNELADKYFTPLGAGRYQVAEALKVLVSFRQHNLLKSPPDDHFDLVLCRNVTIYFTEEAKDQVTRALASALRPGGYLFIGETETIHRPVRFGLALRSPSFYERAAA